MVSTDFHGQNFVPLLQLEKFDIGSLKNKTVILDDAGAFKQLRTPVGGLFRFGRHHYIQVISLDHYAKDVRPIVRKKCLKLYITIITSDNLIESSTNKYSIKDITKCKQYRDQMDYGIIKFDTRTQKFTIYNQKYQVVHSSKTKNRVLKTT